MGQFENGAHVSLSVPYMWIMPIDPNKLELRTYPQRSGYDCKLWDWKIWRGSALLASGTVEGTDAAARREGQAELDRLKDAEDDD